MIWFIDCFFFLQFSFLAVSREMKLIRKLSQCVHKLGCIDDFVILLLAHHMSPPGVGALSPGREHEVGAAGGKPNRSIAYHSSYLPSLIPRPADTQY